MLALLMLTLAMLGADAATHAPRRLQDPTDPIHNCVYGKDLGCRGTDDDHKKDTDGVCHYLTTEDGIKMDNPECNGKCSVAGTAKNKYECIHADQGECCGWDDKNPHATEKQDMAGVCHYMEYEAGIKMDNPDCNGKCSVSGTAKTEYECLNSDHGECCTWDDNKSLDKCTRDAVQGELYLAADTCCDEATETCDTDGWPQTCNLGCAAVMVPLVNKCLPTFSGIGLATAVTPLQTATNKCPCIKEIVACDSDPACEAALDVLPGLIVPEFHEFFTADDGRADHFNAGKYPSSAKAALLKCYQAQNYSEGGGDPCAGVVCGGDSICYAGVCTNGNR